MTGSKVAKIIAYILIVLAIIALIGVVAKFTGGFTTGFKTFYVTIDGKDVMTTGNGFVATEKSPMKVDVKYVFDSDENTEKNYSVKIVPNAVSGKDFDFTLDDEVYAYQSEKDLTAGFDIVMDGNSFTVTPKGSTITEIMQAIYPENTVGNCDESAYEDMFTLIVTSYNGEASVKVNFAMYGNVNGITLDQEVIIF